jgi:peroxiredoxin
VALTVGDTIPDVKLMTLTAEGPKPVQSGDVLGHGKVVLFAVPGAFTPTCNDHHLPGFVMQADEILAKGVDRIACIAVNDAYVMGAWGNAQGTGDKILMLSDGNGEWDRPLQGRPRHPLAALRRHPPGRRGPGDVPRAQPRQGRCRLL